MRICNSKCRWQLSPGLHFQACEISFLITSLFNYYHYSLLIDALINASQIFFMSETYRQLSQVQSQASNQLQEKFQVAFLSRGGGFGCMDNGRQYEGKKKARVEIIGHTLYITYKKGFLFSSQKKLFFNLSYSNCSYYRGRIQISHHNVGQVQLTHKRKEQIDKLKDAIWSARDLPVEDYLKNWYGLSASGIK